MDEPGDNNLWMKISEWAKKISYFFLFIVHPSKNMMNWWDNEDEDKASANKYPA